ncbi:hypothetical protein L2E82_01793 [Cichorium intybus]|uniref:Uncharacterized protein n=1 Tax=Cichorium intybus TaxID=13427 RepID=A0ACB9GZI2_CICIN|nr:hypothetical protein L2E82_01793 [Cichorium intybus]
MRRSLDRIPLPSRVSSIAENYSSCFLLVETCSNQGRDEEAGISDEPSGKSIASLEDPKALRDGTNVDLKDVPTRIM